MNNPKILVAILAINKSPWNLVEELGQDRTWKKSVHPSVQIVRYIGTGKNQIDLIFFDMFWKFINLLDNFLKCNLRDSRLAHFVNVYIDKMNFKVRKENYNTIVVDIPDKYSLIGAKTLAFFGYALSNYDFDYLYRTNTSSYIDIGRLYKFVQTLPDKGVFAGPIGKFKSHVLVSGSGYLLSRELISQIVHLKEKWNHFYIDDVSLSILTLEHLHASHLNSSRIDFSSLDELQNFNPAEHEKNFHFRCKANNYRDTIKIMNFLHLEFLN